MVEEVLARAGGHVGYGTALAFQVSVHGASLTRSGKSVLLWPRWGITSAQMRVLALWIIKSDYVLVRFYSKNKQKLDKVWVWEFRKTVDWNKMPGDRPEWQQGQRHSQVVKKGWCGQALDRRQGALFSCFTWLLNRQTNILYGQQRDLNKMAQENTLCLSSHTPIGSEGCGVCRQCL